MQKLEYLKQLKKERVDTDKKVERLVRLTSQHYQELEKYGGEIIFLSKEAINLALHDKFENAHATLAQARQRLSRFYKKLLAVQSVVSHFAVDVQFRVSYYPAVLSGLQTAEHNILEAKEEFFEARLLTAYLESGQRKFLKPNELLYCDFDSYAGALSDMTGELLRKARIHLMSKGPDNKKTIAQFYEDTKTIYLILSGFSFSNKSGLRPKIEGLKNTISKFEELLLECDRHND
jgi:predicted translin family RNA/ssDNA-binding protein